MIALSRSKRRGEALRVYQRLVTLLRVEYKREASVDTRAVYEAVLRGEDVGEGRVEGQGVLAERTAALGG